MIFVSKYTRLRVFLRPSFRIRTDTATGQDVQIIPPIVAEFENASFDTELAWERNGHIWKEREKHPIRSEKELVEALKAAPGFGNDFFLRKDRTVEELDEQIAALQRERDLLKKSKPEKPEKDNSDPQPAKKAKQK